MITISWQARSIDYKQKLKGVIRPRKHYRCGTCRARRSLRHELWEYIRPPKCYSCRIVDWRLDMSRYKEYITKTGVFDTCNCCGGYWFPHRKGGGVWCDHHPTGPTEQDYMNRYG